MVLGRKTIAAAIALGLAAASPAVAHADGALSGRISFTSFRDGALGDIWTMNPDGRRGRAGTASRAARPRAGRAARPARRRGVRAGAGALPAA